MMAILAVDPSLTATGLCYDTPYGAGQTYDEIKTKKLRGTPRLHFIHAVLYDVIEERPVEERVRWCVMEGYNYGAARGRGNPGRLFDIGELGGMIKMMMQEKEIPLLIVPPASLKMFTTGNGLAQKPEMIEAVHRQWGIRCRSDNVADAIALYHFMEAYLSARRRRRYTPKQKSALAGAAYDINPDTT